jgi:hypothetical protein
VVLLAGLLHRIDVHHRHIQVAEFVHEAVVDLAGYGVPFGHGQFRIHGDVYLGAQSVSQPPRPDLRDVLNAWDVARGVPYLLCYLRVHPVQQAGEDGLTRLPDDNQDGRRYEQSHDGVGEWVAQPHPYGTEQDGETCPTPRAAD